MGERSRLGRADSEKRYKADKNPLIDAADETTKFHYDALGRRDTVTIMDAASVILREEVYGYDAEGRLNRVESPEGVINYAYNNQGQKTDMWTEKSATDATKFSAATYGYDELGRLKTVTQTKLNGVATSYTTTYYYDAVGNLDLTIAPNGITTDYVYGALNRLDLETITKSAQTLRSYDYILLADGQRDYVIETDEANIQTKIDWTYDGLDRLVTETRDEGNDGIQNGNDYTDIYTLDLVGNRVGKIHDAVGTANDETVISAYNGRDQLTSEDSTNNADDTSYTYDNNGSQLTRTKGGVTTVYTWDLHNHMSAIDNTNDGTADVTYQYDSDGVRVSQTASGQTTYYLNDKQNPTGYAKAVEDRSDTNADGRADTPVTSYILGLQVIGQATAADTYFMLLDGHGSTAALTNTSGTLVEEYAYTAFGESIGFGANTAKTNWLFGGDGLWDPKSQMTYHLARWRDGHRFVSYDSFEADPTSPASLHKYVFASGNPNLGTDPSGTMLVAFDGTWNYPGQKDGDGTFVTNIQRLRNLYTGANRFYYRGIGNLQDNSGPASHMLGGEPIAGGTGLGGASILRTAMRDVEKAYAAGDHTIDIVGFSRGAALALAFANMLQKKHLQVNGHEEMPLVRFMGLFDVVGSFGIPGNQINTGYDLGLAEIVRSAYHAMAYDEGRAFFPVTRVSGATEVWFRGVHGDIGSSDLTLKWIIENARKAGVPITLPPNLTYDPWKGDSNGSFRRNLQTGDTSIGFMLPNQKIHFDGWSYTRHLGVH